MAGCRGCRRRKNLYEDFKDGILTKEEYSMLREQYQEQAARIEDSIMSLEKEKAGLRTGRTAGQEWVDALKRYKGVERLERGLAAVLIDRVESWTRRPCRCPTGLRGRRRKWSVL